MPPLTNREEFTLEDGRVLTLERVDYGSGDIDYFIIEHGRRQRAKRRLVLR